MVSPRCGGYGDAETRTGGCGYLRGVVENEVIGLIAVVVETLA
jgi:hypothetical protein